ncbi:MAG: hypothetical protein ABW250_12320 [Pyrinomonadaceae bacterium]
MAYPRDQLPARESSQNYFAIIWRRRKKSARHFSTEECRARNARKRRDEEQPRGGKIFGSGGGLENLKFQISNLKLF